MMIVSNHNALQWAGLARSFLILALLACARPGHSTSYTARSAAEIKAHIRGLQAGDTLLIAAGSYDIGALWFKNTQGTENAWIVIKGKGGLATLLGSKHDNVVNLDSVSYLRFENIAITTNGAYNDIDGVKFRSNSHHVLFKRCRIYNITNVAINSQVPEMHHIVVSECEISHCGTAAIYWGFNKPLKVARDCLIERSYIHHCPTDLNGATGYGIQIKGGSYRNIVRNSVLHDVGGTTRAGIAVYYTDLSGGLTAADNNTVSGNVIWNVSNEGIYAAAGVTLENNIIFDANTGLAIYPYDGSVVENVIVRNNTIYRCREDGLLISGWDNAGKDCMIVNNVSYMDSWAADALEARSRGNAVFSNNIYFGNAKGFGAGAVLGQGPAIDFVSAGAGRSVPNLDFYPAQNSGLIEAGTVAYGVPATDFNGSPRPEEGKCGAGAYEYSKAGNPGWRIARTFKNAAQRKGQVRPGTDASNNTPARFD
jgi:hypothetical protein